MRIDVKAEQTLEDGTYPATLLSIEERDTVHGERLLWKFEVTHEGQRLEKDGWTSMSNSERGNLVKWAGAILGSVGESLDTDDLIGKPCTVVIETYEDKDGNERDKVKNVKAPKKGQKGKPEPVEENEEDFDEIPF